MLGGMWHSSWATATIQDPLHQHSWVMSLTADKAFSTQLQLDGQPSSHGCIAECAMCLQVTHTQAAHEARNLHLEGCGHRHDAPFPPLPTDMQLKAAAAWRKGTVQAVSRPSLRARSHQREQLWAVPENTPPVKPQNGSAGPASAAAGGEANGQLLARAPHANGITTFASRGASSAAAESASNASERISAQTATRSAATSSGHQVSRSQGPPAAAAFPSRTHITHRAPSTAAQSHSTGANGWTVVAQRPSRQRMPINAGRPANMNSGPYNHGRRERISTGEANCVEGSRNHHHNVSFNHDPANEQTGSRFNILQAPHMPPSSPPVSAVSQPAIQATAQQVPRLIPGAEDFQAGPSPAVARRLAARSARRARARATAAAAMTATTTASEAGSSIPASPSPGSMTPPNLPTHVGLPASAEVMPNGESQAWQEIPAGRPAGRHPAGSTPSSSTASQQAARPSYDRPAHELISEAHAAHAAEIADHSYSGHPEQPRHGSHAGQQGPCNLQEGTTGGNMGYMGELGCPAGPMGPLMDALPTDTLSVIMSLLQPRDLASLSMTCRGLRAVVEEGSVWQTLLHREFPGSHMTASSAADWKHAYLMQVANVLSLHSHQIIQDESYGSTTCRYAVKFFLPATHTCISGGAGRACRHTFVQMKP